MSFEPKPLSASSAAHLCRLVATTLLLLITLGACAEFTGELSQLPFQSSLASFGTNARIQAEISPGAVLCARHPSPVALGDDPSTSALCAADDDGESRDPFVAVLRSSAPLPVLFFDNGEPAPQQLRVRLTNTQSDLATSVVLLPLRSEAPRASACSAPSPPATYLTPPAETRRSTTEREWLLLIPPCSTLSLRSALPAERNGSFRLLVAGPNANADAALDTLLADANSWPADHIHFLGGMLDPNAAEPAARLLSTIEPRISVPYTISLGDAERDAGRDTFFARFGPADYSSMLGNVRLLTLDTSDGELSTEQLDFVSALKPAPVGIALLFHGPALPAAVAHQGLVSQERSLRLLETLRTKGINHLFAVSDRAERATANATQLFQLTDPDDETAANYARVTISNIRSEAPVVSVELRSAK